MPQTSDAPAIRLQSLTKVFPGSERPAVDNLDLDVAEGAIAAFVGPSGCGKTTTLKMINRLIEPTSGTIEVLGRPNGSMPHHELRRQIGYVIQQIGLFPHRKIADNIATVPKLLGWDKSKTRSRVEELVDLVGLDRSLLDRYPGELSGGQQQRVGVARALAADPPILLMDEPYSAVDPIVRGRLQDELLDLQRRVRKTIVIVTHDVEEAIKLGDRVAVFNVGGILEQEAAPDELLKSPASPFVEQFLGAERGLRRLGLRIVEDARLDDGPVVVASASAADATAAMDSHGTDWVAVTDNKRLLGWVGRSSLDGSTVGNAGPRPFKATITCTTPLREALDGIVLSETKVAAIVDDDGDFVGILSLEALGEGLR